jgi:hypothetical protein
MTTTAIISGIILILIGVAGYVNGHLTGHASITALIPAFIGIALAALGAVGKTSEALRKHLMHVAVLIALIGFLLTAGRLVMRLSELTMSPAVLSQAATALVCLVFVILSIKSFRDARRNS